MHAWVFFLSHYVFCTIVLRERPRMCCSWSYATRFRADMARTGNRSFQKLDVDYHVDCMLISAPSGQGNIEAGVSYRSIL